MAATDLFARRATLSRSVRLLSEFRFEQSDPARFYSALAEDTAAMVTDLWHATHREPAAGPHAARRRWRPRLLRDGLQRRRVRPTSASSPTRPRCMRAPRPEARPPTSAPRAWRCRSPTTASTSACPPTSPSTCREPWRLGARDAAGHPARRPGGAVLHGVAGPVRRARDGSDATTSAAPAPPAAMPANTAIRRRTTTDRRCSRSPPPTA